MLPRPPSPFLVLSAPQFPYSRFTGWREEEWKRTLSKCLDTAVL